MTPDAEDPGYIESPIRCGTCFVPLDSGVILHYHSS